MRRSLSSLPPDELERLSAYLDGRLSPTEAGRLEARLASDPELKAMLAEMRMTIRLLAALPEVKPPRSFVLTPAMVGKPARSWTYPALQLGTALATLAFLIVTGVSALLRLGGAAAPAMAPMERSVAQEAPADMEVTRVVEFAEPPAAEPQQEATAASLFAEAPPPGLEAAAAPTGELGGGPGEEARGGLQATASASVVPGIECAVCPLAALTKTAAGGVATAPAPMATPAADTPTPILEAAPAEPTALALLPMDQALKAGLPSATAMPTTVPSEVITPGRLVPIPVSPLGILQVGLGAAAIVLAVLTIRARRKR